MCQIKCFEGLSINYWLLIAHSWLNSFGLWFTFLALTSLIKENVATNIIILYCLYYASSMLLIFTGSLIDRFNRKKLFIFVSTIKLVICIPLFISVFYTKLEYAFVSLAISTTCRSIERTIKSTVLPLLVDNKLTLANTIDTIQFNSASVLGMIFGGLTVKYSSPIICIIIETICFIISFILLFMINITNNNTNNNAIVEESNDINENNNETNENTNILNMIKGTFTYLKQNLKVIVLLLIAFWNALLWEGFEIQNVIQDFSINNSIYVYLNTTIGVLLGSIVALKIDGGIWHCIFGFFLVALGALIVNWTLLGLSIKTFGFSLISIYQIVLLQNDVPNEILGRIIGISSVFDASGSLISICMANVPIHIWIIICWIIFVLFLTYGIYLLFQPKHAYTKLNEINELNADNNI